MLQETPTKCSQYHLLERFFWKIITSKKESAEQLNVFKIYIVILTF